MIAFIGFIAAENQVVVNEYLLRRRAAAFNKVDRTSFCHSKFQASVVRAFIYVYIYIYTYIYKV